MISLQHSLTSRTKHEAHRKKRKWREIEALKEKHQLKKELEELDWTADYAIDDLSIN